MKKILFLALICLPMLSFAQDKKGVPSKARQTSSFSAPSNDAFEYVMLIIEIEKGVETFNALVYDPKTSGSMNYEKYRSLIQALHDLGAEGYEVIHVNDKPNTNSGIIKEYLLMKAVPKKRPQMSEKK